MAQDINVKIKYNERSGMSFADTVTQVDWLEQHPDRIEFIKHKPFVLVDDDEYARVTHKTNEPTLSTTNGLLAVHDSLISKIDGASGDIQDITTELMHIESDIQNIYSVLSWGEF